MCSHTNTQRSSAASGPPSVDWSECAAFLDFDGTLAPLADHPTDVTLPGRETDILRRLHAQTGGAVAILSGRDLTGIRPYFKSLPLVLSGSHGAEIDFPDDEDVEVAAFTIPRASRDRLEHYAEAHDLLLERKAAAYALHYRTHPELAEEIRALVEEVAASDPDTLRALHGRMVGEVAVRGHDKGTALTALMERPVFRARRPVAVGDDTTDEDAIRAAQRLGGIGLRIGTAPTEADYAFPDREAFVDWLASSTGGA